MCTVGVLEWKQVGPPDDDMIAPSIERDDSSLDL